MSSSLCVYVIVEDLAKGKTNSIKRGGGKDKLNRMPPLVMSKDRLIA